MDIFFTYLKNSTQKKIIDSLDKEIDYLDDIIASRSKVKVCVNKLLNDYSKSLFILSEDDDIILN